MTGTTTLPHSRPAGRLETAHYPYHEADGSLAYQVVRYDPKDFRQRRPDPNRPGHWHWNLEGVKRIPYRLPELLTAPRDRAVFVVEGEKDADRLHAAGLVATTNAGGALKWHTLDGATVARALAGRHVVIVPDNDDPGRKHAGQVRKALEGVAASVRVLELPGLPPKGDSSDWMDAGGGAEGLLGLVAELPERGDAYEPEAGRAASAPRVPAGLPEKTDLTDEGNACYFARLYRDRLRYCEPWGKWVCWEGTHWARDERLRADLLAGEAARRMYRDATAALTELDRLGPPVWADERRRREDAVAWALRLHSDARLTAMTRRARSFLGVAPEEFNRDPWLYTCANGTLDLRTGELRGHRHEDYVTQLCPVAYRPGAACPLWEAFLASVFPAGRGESGEGNRPLIGFVQRLLGYCLTGRVSEQALFFFWGDGANGKSTLLNTVSAVMGRDYAGKAAPGLLMAGKSERHPSELADLFGKRLSVSNETDQAGRLNEAVVKELTGGEAVKSRRLYEDWWEFAPTHKLIVCGNHRPKVGGLDHGIWRRLKLVPFAQRFWNPSTPPRPGEDRPEHLRQDKGLGDKLSAESEGILAWMVRGCLEWQRGGLAEPPEVVGATDGYRQEEDTFGRFVADRCLLNPAFRVKAGAMYAAFRDWMEGEGERHVPSQKVFGTWATAHGLERRGNGPVWYVGVTVRDDGPVGD